MVAQRFFSVAFLLAASFLAAAEDGPIDETTTITQIVATATATLTATQTNTVTAVVTQTIPTDVPVPFTTTVIAPPPPPPAPAPAPAAGPPTSKCNSGSPQCCQSIQLARSVEASKYLQKLGIALSGNNLNVKIGINCTPLSILGLHRDSTCSTQPVCCENNGFNGVVAIGCTPANAHT